MKALLTLVVALACLATAATSVDAKPKARAKAPQRTIVTAFNYADHAALLYKIPLDSTYHDLGDDVSSTVLPGGRIEFLCQTSPDEGSLKDAAEGWFDSFNHDPLITDSGSYASVSGHDGAYFSTIGSFIAADKKIRDVEMKVLAIHGEQHRAVVCGALTALKASKAQRAVLDRIFKSFVLMAPYPPPAQ